MGIITPRINDSLRLMAGLSGKRLLNAGKIYLSYYLTRLTGKNIPMGFPISAAIEPTTTCNLGCPECPAGLKMFTRPRGLLPMDKFRSYIDQLADHIFYLTLYFQGEPYQNPAFFDFVKYAREKKIYVATSTNAHYLGERNARKTIESGLDRLIISLDGLDQESYAKYRIGGKLDRVLQGIKNVVKFKKELKAKNPYIIIQFVVFRTNEHQIEDVKRLGKELGVDEVQIKTAQINDYKNGSPLIPTINKYSRYKKLPDGTYAFKNKLPNRCFRMWNSCVITWDGLIVPCCFDKDAEYRMGDLKETNFIEIWRSKAYNDFRKKVFSNRKSIDICSNCTEGMRHIKD